MAIILVVDDDSSLREALVEHLRDEGHEARGVGDAASLRHTLASCPVDLLLLDLGLPDEDGLVLTIELRRKYPQLGIVMVTARDGLADRISGLRLGADAYVVKPFHFGELSAVVDSVLRRTPAPAPSPGPAPEARTGENTAWLLDSITWELIRPGATTGLKLSPGEYHFVHALAQAPSQRASRAQLVVAVSANPTTYDPRNLDALLRRLRRKIEAATGGHAPIQAVHAQGYVFTAPLVLR